MNDVLGWGTVVLILAVPVVFVAVAATSRRRQKSGHADAPSSGGLLGFDELFHPNAHNARIQWETEEETPVPAPTPDTGPGVLDEGGKIVIEVGEGGGGGSGSG